MARETWVQSQVESYQRLKKWYLMPPCLTLSIIRYGTRVKWSNPGKGVAPSPTPWCSKLSKREPSGHPRLWSPTLLFYINLKKNVKSLRKFILNYEYNLFFLNSEFPTRIKNVYSSHDRHMPALFKLVRNHNQCYNYVFCGNEKWDRYT